MIRLFGILIGLGFTAAVVWAFISAKLLFLKPSMKAAAWSEGEKTVTAI